MRHEDYSRKGGEKLRVSIAITKRIIMTTPQNKPLIIIICIIPSGKYHRFKGSKDLIAPIYTNASTKM
jgi:hypothetical protein